VLGLPTTDFLQILLKYTSSLKKIEAEAKEEIKNLSMTKIVITGSNSEIAKRFVNLSPYKTEFVFVNSSDIFDHWDADKYFFCQGFLAGQNAADITSEEYDKTWNSNLFTIVEACDKIIDTNERARICIISSESAYRGSYDTTYAKSKKAINTYIEDKKLKFPAQQLVGIAPSIIEDTRMTWNRKDTENINNKRNSHPMKRFCYSLEVAELAFTLLYEQPYINRTVIRMHGGNLE
jgi:NAD(P)-dependent dehydrogenase (short-subunit alcohol dehydrogenase family)